MELKSQNSELSLQLKSNITEFNKFKDDISKSKHEVISNLTRITEQLNINEIDSDKLKKGSEDKIKIIPAHLTFGKKLINNLDLWQSSITKYFYVNNLRQVNEIKLKRTEFNNDTSSILFVKDLCNKFLFENILKGFPKKQIYYILEMINNENPIILQVLNNFYKSSDLEILKEDFHAISKDKEYNREKIMSFKKFGRHKIGSFEDLFLKNLDYWHLIIFNYLRYKNLLQSEDIKNKKFKNKEDTH